MKIKWYRYKGTRRVEPPIEVTFKPVTSRESVWQDLQRIIKEDFEPWVTKNWPDARVVTVQSWAEPDLDFAEISRIEKEYQVNILYGIPMRRDVSTGKLTFLD